MASEPKHKTSYDIISDRKVSDCPTGDLAQVIAERMKRLRKSSSNVEGFIAKIKRFIKESYHKSKSSIKNAIIKYDLWTKLLKLVKLGIDVAITGIIIYYSITHFNWFSVGIISALAMYYIEWFIKLVKRKEDNNGTISR